jgi:competence protein ComEC
MYELSNIYEFDENEFILTIEEFNIDGDKLSFEFKENLVGIYYIKTEEEKNNIDLSLNDKLYLKGKLELPSNNTIMNTFNYKKYLYYKDIEYILYIDEFYIYEHNNNFFHKIKNFVINRILNIDNEYIYAFILGETEYIDSEVYDSYKVNGITHLFSLSALHVSVFSSIIYFVLKKMKFNEIVILLFIVIFLVFFSFISSFSVSMLRASIFFFFRKINEIFKLKINVLNLFYLTLVILLFINPMYIFNYGFILSFVITYFILIFSKNSLKSNLLKVSFVSFLASLPIIINMSFEVNIVCFFNNVLFIPFVSYLVFPCSLITFVFFKFDIVLNILISIMEFISNISTSYMKVNVIFSKFSILEILIYYFILYIAIVKYKKVLYILFIFVLFIQIKN